MSHNQTVKPKVLTAVWTDSDGLLSQPANVVFGILFNFKLWMLVRLSDIRYQSASYYLIIVASI